MRVTLVDSRSLSPRDAEDYDRFVADARDGHYSQARMWSALATAGRPLLARYFIARDDDKVVGAGLVLQPHASILRAPVAKMERGPVCDDPERVAGVARAFARAARVRGIARTTVMPYWSEDAVDAVERALAEVRYRSVQELDGAHTYTLRLAIGGTKSDADVLAGSERKKLRSELKQAEKNGATVRTGTADDVAVFARLYGDLMQRQGRATKPRVWFDALARTIGESVSLFVVTHENEDVAAILIVRHGKQATFVMGASDASRRPFTKMAPALMHAIRWARDAGCEVFDLGGVPMPGDTDEKRVNIARFKYDFVTKPVRLVAEHSRWL